MDEGARKSRNSSKELELWPAFRLKVQAIITDPESHGFRPRIQDAWRSPADQLAAFSSGHSKLRYGFHNVTGPDGRKESLAVDLLDDDHPNQESSRYLLMLAAAAESHGLMTGIRWGVPSAMAAAIDRAIAAKYWNAPVKVGWDPCHVQPAGFSAADAKRGKRI